MGALTCGDATIDAIKDQATEVAGCESFAELAAILVAERLARRGRSFDAQRILRSYLKRHPMTPRISATLRGLGA